MFKLIYSKQFFVDIWYIKAHITFKLDNPSAANSIFNEVMDKSETLSEFPERFPQVVINNVTYHRMIVKKFNVYYCVNKNNQTVTIARVLYSGMDINQVAIIN